MREKRIKKNGTPVSQAASLFFTFFFLFSGLIVDHGTNGELTDGESTELLESPENHGLTELLESPENHGLTELLESPENHGLILSRQLRAASESIEGNRMESNYTCEGKSLTISCPDDFVINVTHATYERRLFDICTSGHNVPKDSVSQENFTCNSTCENERECIELNNKVVIEKCKDQTSCSLTAKNTYFNDTCFEVHKYLMVNYTCVRPNSNSSSQTRATVAGIGGTAVTPSSSSSSALTSSLSRRDDEPGEIICDEIRSGLVDSAATAACVSKPVRDLKYKLQEILGNQSDLSRVRNLTLDVLEDVLTITKDLEKISMQGGDIVAISDMLNQVTNLFTESGGGKEPPETAQRAHQLVTTMASLMLDEAVTRGWKTLPLALRSHTATRLLTAVEESAFLLAESLPDSSRQVNRVHRNIALQVHVVTPGDEGEQSGLEFSPSSSVNSTDALAPTAIHNGDDDYDDADDDVEARVYIKLSSADLKEATRAAGSARVVFIRYKNLYRWLAKSNSDNNNNNSSKGNQSDQHSAQTDTAAALEEEEEEEDSFVISASINRRTAGQQPLSEGVEYRLKHSKLPADNTRETVCAYWQYTESDYVGSWQTDGCRVKNRTESHTICECNHLTNFAVLMSPTNQQMEEVHKTTLYLITYLGCALSCVCLLLAFITFQRYSVLQNDRNTIHKNLALCLLVANLVFMGGIAQYQYKGLCTVIAVLLHYLFLSAFSWMCLEGVQLYVLLVEVFESERSRTLWYYLAAYGFPALVVLTTVLVDYRGYGTENYCWLQVDGGFIWAFLGPVIVIIVVNLIMLSITIQIMCKHAGNDVSWKMKNSSRLETVGSWVKGAFVLMILLGSTWIFGLFYIDQHSLFMAYLFTIFNSLQGAFIFIFHCLLNDKVRNEYRKTLQNSNWLPGVMREKLSATSTSTTSTSSGSAANRFIKLLRKKSQTSLQKPSFLHKSDTPEGQTKESTKRSKSWIHTAFTRVRTTDSYPPGLAQDSSGYMELSMTNTGEEEFIAALESLKSTPVIES